MKYNKENYICWPWSKQMHMPNMNIDLCFCVHIPVYKLFRQYRKYWIIINFTYETMFLLKNCLISSLKRYNILTFFLRTWNCNISIWIISLCLNKKNWYPTPFIPKNIKYEYIFSRLSPVVRDSDVLIKHKI